MQTMLGMGCVVTKKSVVKPGHIYVGNPARELGLNTIGLDRNGIDEMRLQQLTEEFEALRA